MAARSLVVGEPQHIAPVVEGGCTKTEKKIDHWRQHFMPLSEILCWPAALVAPPPKVPLDNATLFAVGGGRPLTPPEMTGGFHPDIVAERLNRKLAIQPAQDDGRIRRTGAVPKDRIPLDIRRAIDGEVNAKDRAESRRPAHHPLHPYEISPPQTLRGTLLSTTIDVNPLGALCCSVAVLCRD